MEMITSFVELSFSTKFERSLDLSIFSNLWHIWRIRACSFKEVSSLENLALFAGSRSFICVVPFEVSGFGRLAPRCNFFYMLGNSTWTLSCLFSVFGVCIFIDVPIRMDLMELPYRLTNWGRCDLQVPLWLFEIGDYNTNENCTKITASVVHEFVDGMRTYGSIIGK